MENAACRRPPTRKQKLSFVLAVALLPNCQSAASLEGSTEQSTPREAPSLHLAFFDGTDGRFVPPNRVAGRIKVHANASDTERPELHIDAKVPVFDAQIRQSPHQTIWEGSLDFSSQADGPVYTRFVATSVTGVATVVEQILIVDQTPPTLTLHAPLALRPDMSGTVQLHLEDGFPSDHLTVKWHLEAWGQKGAIQLLRGADLLDLTLDAPGPLVPPPAVILVVEAADPLGNRSESRIRIPVRGAAHLPDVIAVPMVDQGAAVPLDQLSPDTRSFRRMFESGLEVSRFEVRNNTSEPMRFRAVSNLSALIEYSVGPWIAGLTLEMLEAQRLSPHGAPVLGEGPLRVELNATCHGERQVLLDPQYWQPDDNRIDIYGGVCEPHSPAEARAFSQLSRVQPSASGWIELAPGDAFDLRFELPPPGPDPVLMPLLQRSVQGLNAQHLQSGFAAVSVTSGENCMVCDHPGCQVAPKCQPAGVYFGERLEAILALNTRFEWLDDGTTPRFGLELQTAHSPIVLPLPLPAAHSKISALTQR